MAISLQKFRGALALVGPEIDNMAISALQSVDFQITRDSSEQYPYHITLMTKDELRSLPPDQIPDISSLNLEARHIFSAGVGGIPGGNVYWVVIIWAAGQQIRKRFRLPAKNFHITLSSKDIHDVGKGLDSLLPGQYPLAPTPEFIDHSSFTFCSLGQHQQAHEYAYKLILLDSESPKGFLRLGETALENKSYKLAMLSYACAYECSSQEKMQAFCLKKIIECSKETEWGAIFQEHEIDEVMAWESITSLLLRHWSQKLRDSLSEQKLSPTLYLEPRQRLYVPLPLKSAEKSSSRQFHKLPRFFRWLIPYHLAIMSTPRNEDDIAVLDAPFVGIRHILTLTEESPLHQSWFRNKQVTNTFLPVANFFPPSIEQMDLVISLFDNQDNLPLLVHCGGGKGRAGTVAACYLAAFGFNKPQNNQDHPELSAVEAIAVLRSLRPGSLETSQQESFVSKWCSTIWQRLSVYPEIPSEPPPSAMEVEGGQIEGDLYVLVGLPGSGKSWFSKSLLARNPSGWVHISQDDTGNRASCEIAIGYSPKGKCVLLDRCNTAASDRKLWLQLTSNWSTSPICIWFDYDHELCTSRAQRRPDHPTLPPGSRVRTAVEQMRNLFVKPTLQEGFKAIVTVRSFAAAEEAVLRLSPQLTILKFPRTPHIIDVGAATSDDVHTDFSSFASISSAHAVISEKIDGANMGFSLSSDGSQIIAQNRSHYINSSTHEQFKKLGLWIERHEEELKNILKRDRYFPERYTLYGEWMYATHSIPYTRLPDYFIAYDLYDRSTQTWANTDTLHSLLIKTSIFSVPILHRGAMPTDTELLTMIQQPSAFYDGRVEGVYIKTEANGIVQLRGKVVRSDFIAGNEHWTKGNILVNGIILN